MKDFFDVLSALLSSDFAKDYRCVIIVLFIFCVFSTAFIVSIIFNKLILPYKLSRANYIMPNYQNALAEIEELREKNIELKKELNEYKNMKKMTEAIEAGDLIDGKDEALKTFMRNSRQR